MIRNGRTTIHLQQRLSELSALILPPLKMELTEPRLVLLEVLQSTIQLPEDMIQPLDEICPMVSHPNSTEIFPSYGTNPVEIVGVETIPLRPDEKQVRLENFNVLERPDRLDDGTIGSGITSQAEGWERRPLRQP